MTIRETDEQIAAALRAGGFYNEARSYGPYTTKRVDDALALRAQTIVAQAEDVKALRAFVRAIWDEVYADHGKPRTIEDVRAVVAEALGEDALFETCDVCGGSGEIVDEIPDEFGTQRIRGGCTGCIDGRFPR